MLRIPLFLVSYSLLPSFANAYTWQWTTAPQQCKNVSLSIQGSDGQGPYSLMLIPSGPSPLPNNIEARSIETIPFPDGSTTLNFKLNYPANSQFVAVVSDHQKFGTGGTSLPLSVGSSDDTSCFNSQQSVKGPWTFSIDPTGGLTQCSTTRLWWQQPFVNGSVNFVGVIPGGDSFLIPQGPLSKDSQGTGFNWTVNVRGGTNMFIVAGDDRGLGAGGSAPFTVAYASNDDNSCIQNNAPSSTPGAAAGATPTSSTPSDGSSGGSHTGPIVGGVIGGLCFAAVLAVLLFFIIRRKRPSNSTKERPVDLLQDHDDDGPPTQSELPQYYEPEPFLVPDPTIAATSDAGSTHNGDEEIGMPSYARSRRPSSFGTTTDGFLRPATPGASSMSGTSRKGHPPPVMRPVNFIQHDDAGPSEGVGEDPETIELPPAYTNIRSGPPPPADA